MKIAWCALVYSTTVASRRRVTPPRGEVTCTGTRTALAWGKKRANCSEQLFSFATSTELPFLATSPHDVRLRSVFCRGSRDTPRSNRRTLDGGRNVHAASQRILKIEAGEGVETERLRIFPQRMEGAHVSPLKRYRLSGYRGAVKPCPSRAGDEAPVILAVRRGRAPRSVSVLGFSKHQEC